MTEPFQCVICEWSIVGHCNASQVQCYHCAHSRSHSKVSFLIIGTNFLTNSTFTHLRCPSSCSEY